MALLNDQLASLVRQYGLYVVQEAVTKLVEADEDEAASLGLVDLSDDDPDPDDPNRKEGTHEHDNASA